MTNLIQSRFLSEVDLSVVVRACACVYACVCVRACVYACVCMCFLSSFLVPWFPQYLAKVSMWVMGLHLIFVLCFYDTMFTFGK